MKKMTSRAASSRSPSRRRRWLVLGNPENRRTKLFQAALRELDQPSAQVISYRELLQDQIDLSEVLDRFADEPCVLRIDSPGEDHIVERALIARGASNFELLSSGRPFRNVDDRKVVSCGISRSAALRLREDRGR